METVDPRTVLKKCFELMDLYPTNIPFVNIVVYTTVVGRPMIGYAGSFFEITKINQGYQVMRFSDDNRNLEPVNVNSFDDFIKLLRKNEYITHIFIEDIARNTVRIFICDEENCLDRRKASANVIQTGFKKSKNYAAWAYSPERLASQGYFKTEFGGAGASLSSVEHDLRYLSKKD